MSASFMYDLYNKHLKVFINIFNKINYNFSILIKNIIKFNKCNIDI